MNEWSSADQKRLVVFPPDVLAVFWKYRQRYFWQPESGGILLGRRRGRHLEVVMATQPGSRDERSQYAFVREAAGHAEMALQAWRQGDQQIDYLGEWHTHPQRVPVPSGIDRVEWDKLVEQRQESSTLLTVVVGTQALSVELLSRVEHAVMASISSVRESMGEYLRDVGVDPCGRVASSRNVNA